MLLYCRVFDGAVAVVDFPFFSIKTCQVKFLKNLNYFHSYSLVGYSNRACEAFTL
jgi:hypothetical protein